MAPATKRQRTSGPQTSAKSSQQSQLSFRSTKAGRRQTQVKEEKPAKENVVEIEQEEIASAEPVQATPVKADPAETEAEGPALEEEEDEEQTALDNEARSMSEAKLKSYWIAKEKERKAPRIHQQGLTVREKILREWDMSSRYGPSVGIKRLPRWRRAYDLALNPPIEVLAVLLKEEDAQSKKPDGSVRKDVQTSIIDELTLSSRLKGEGVEA